jgi:hypothetical protein
MSRRRARGALDYFVAPSASRARVLVPAAVPQAARMYVRHGGGRVESAVWQAWRRAHRSGLAARLPLSRLSVTPDPDGIEAYLGEALGEPVAMGVLLGPPRANRKPVLQVFAADGRTVGFGKLGLSDLTTRLLTTEAEALTRLDAVATATFKAPRPLVHGTWKQHAVLVQQPLASAQSGRAPKRPPVDVIVEIAGLAGIEAADLRTAGQLDRLTPSEASWHGIDLGAFQRLGRALADADDAVPMGAWHGDFGPWNMGVLDGQVEVWDWERFATDVPVGLDAAHYRTQVSVRDQADPEQAVRVMVSEVKDVLHRAGQPDTAASAVVGYYLLTILDRYRADAGADPTPALRRRTAWLAAAAAVVTHQLEEPTR